VVQVVGEDFGAEVLLQCQVVQARDGVQPKAVLQTFERAGSNRKSENSARSREGAGI
jgi:hypothetical protein